MSNLFWFTGALRGGPEQLSCVERRDFVSEILRRLDNGEYVQIIGPHQSGRSTVAVQLDTYIRTKRKDEYYPVLLSGESMANAQLDTFAHVLLARMCKEASTLLPPAFSENLIPRNGSCQAFELSRALMRIGEDVASNEHAAFIIVIDEITSMQNTTVIDVLSVFRGLFERYSADRLNAPFRVVVVATRDLQRWRLANRSPFNISRALEIPPFSPEEFATLLDNDHVGKALHDLSFGADARRTVFHESGGNAYFIQRLCHAMVEGATGGPRPLELTHKDAIRAVLSLFEGPDENLKSLNQEIPPDSPEWALCRKLACGMRILYRGVQTETDRLAELGVLVDKDGYCHIPVNLYRRRIIGRAYNESYSDYDYLFEDDDERFLLGLSSIQALLLNVHVRHALREHVREFREPATDAARTEGVFRVLGALAHERKLTLALEEVKIFLEFYNRPVPPTPDDILRLAARWFALVLPSESVIPRSSHPQGA